MFRGGEEGAAAQTTPAVPTRRSPASSLPGQPSGGWWHRQRTQALPTQALGRDALPGSTHAAPPPSPPLPSHAPAGQHIALHEPPKENHIGLICTRCSPVNVAQDAINDARSICLREYGAAPDVTVYGDPRFVFPYVPSHLHHMLFELVSGAFGRGGGVAGSGGGLPQGGRLRVTASAAAVPRSSALCR